MGDQQARGGNKRGTEDLQWPVPDFLKKRVGRKTDPQWPQEPSASSGSEGQQWTPRDGSFPSDNDGPMADLELQAINKCTHSEAFNYIKKYTGQVCKV